MSATVTMRKALRREGPWLAAGVMLATVTASLLGPAREFYGLGSCFSLSYSSSGFVAWCLFALVSVRYAPRLAADAASPARRWGVGLGCVVAAVLPLSKLVCAAPYVPLAVTFPSEYAPVLALTTVASVAVVGVCVGVLSSAWRTDGRTSAAAA